MRMRWIVFSLSLFLPVGAVVFAQSEAVTKAELEVQSGLLDAAKEKMLGNWEEALKILRRLKDNSASDATVHFELARVHLAMEEEESALAEIQSARELDPGNIWYGLYLAEIYEAKNELAPAAGVYASLAESHPDTYHFYDKWIRALVASGENEDAIRVIERRRSELGISESDVRIKYDLHRKLGQDELALKELEHLKVLAFNELDYMHLVARHHRETGHEDQAAEMYRRILELDKNDPEANLALASGERGSDLYLYSLRDLVGNSAIGIEAKIKEIIPYLDGLEKGKYATELEDLGELLVKTHADDPKAHAILGDIFFIQGKYPNALASYRTTLRDEQGVLAVWENSLWILAKDNRAEELLELSEDALDVFPNQAIVNYYHALALARLYRLEEAGQILRQVTLMAGNDANLLVNSHLLEGMILGESGDAEESKSSFQEALSLAPESPDVKAQFALSLARHGEDLEQARELATDVLKRNNQHLTAIHAMALIQMHSGEYASALKSIESCLASDAESPSLLETRGDIYYSSGEVDLALEEWKRAKEMGSRSPRLERKIETKSLHK